MAGTPAGTSTELYQETLRLSSVPFGMLSDPIRHQPVHELVSGAVRSVERQPGQHVDIVNRIFQLQQALRNVFANLLDGYLPQ